MIKVLETKTWQCRCWQCRSTLQYEWSDVKPKRVSDYTGDTERRQYITCPVCQTDTAVDPHKNERTN